MNEREVTGMALAKESWKTIADLEALPEGTRAELIDGSIFFDTAPTVAHQTIVSFLHGMIWNYIRSKNGTSIGVRPPYDFLKEKGSEIKEF